MNITTKYKTNHNGTGQIVAKSGGKQKTIPFDPARTSAQNHGDAAGEFILAKVDQIFTPSLIATITHRSNDSGTQHAFTV